MPSETITAMNTSASESEAGARPTQPSAKCSKERLEILAKARVRALEVRRANAEVRRKEKELKDRLFQQRKKEVEKLEAALDKRHDSRGTKSL